MQRALYTRWASIALAVFALFCTGRARAEGDDRLTIYVSPGFVYSGLDEPNGKHAVGGELSVPFAWKNLAAGPFSQVQWTKDGPHYIVGAELVYLVGALELGWFVHESRAERQGFSVAALFGVGMGWIGPRMSVDSTGDVSFALNLSLKAPLNVHGCHWIRASFSGAGCGVQRKPHWRDRR